MLGEPADEPVRKRARKGSSQSLADLSTADEWSRESMHSTDLANPQEPMAKSTSDWQTAPSFFPFNSTAMWQSMLASTKSAIVMLKVALFRNYQEEKPMVSDSTGFVVDAKQGLILTNCHCVSQGPSRVVAVFMESEELLCEQVYNDPVHDFAFIRYDPTRLRRTKVVEIPLCPEQLAVGMEACVVGNDAGEKYQVLPFIMARLDSDVPDNDMGENSFFAAASSKTSEGSSGSPVLTLDGKCVALNVAVACKGKGGFFLPLERVCHCLDLLRQGKHVPRGTLGTSFVFRDLEEARRLGVPGSYQDEAALHERPGINAGMLVVQRTLRGSKTGRHLRSGDVLLAVGSQPCFDFMYLEAYLDAHVGQNAQIRICRGGTVLDLNIFVHEIHELMPNSLLEFGFGVFHDVGYWLAAQYNLPIKNAGVFAPSPGLVFEEALGDHKCVITHVNGHATPNLGDFEAAILRLADNESFSFGYLNLSNASQRRTRATLQEGTARMVWSCSGIQGWEVKGLARKWTPRAIKLGRSELTLADVDREMSPSREHEASCKKEGEESEDSETSQVLAKLRGSLALVQFRGAGNFATEFLPNPCKKDKNGDESKEEGKKDSEDDGPSKSGRSAGPRKGVAIILDAASGLCVTDRLTVPEMLGSIELTFGTRQSSPIPAQAVFLHPHHNLAFLKCNPADLPCGLQSAKLVSEVGEEKTMSEQDDAEEDQSGHDSKRDNAEDGNQDDSRDENAQDKNQDKRAGNEKQESNQYFVGLNTDNQFVCVEATVSTVVMSSFSPVHPTAWRPRNTELISLSDSVEALGGVICDANGTVLALYWGFPGNADEVVQYGISVNCLGKLPRCLVSSTLPLACSVPSLDIEFSSKSLEMLKREPRHRRLSAEWCKRLQAANEALREHVAKPRADQVIWVSGVMPGGTAEGSVQVGDVLLAVNGSPVTSPTAVEQAVWQESKKSVVLTLHRCGKIVEREVFVAQVQSDGASRAVMWNGYVLRETPRAVCEAFGFPDKLQRPGVFCTRVLPGSPASEGGFEEAGDCFLQSVGGHPIQSLDDLLAVVKGRLQDNYPLDEGFVRVESTDLAGWDDVTNVRECPTFWPTLELRYKSDGSVERIEH